MNDQAICETCGSNRWHLFKWTTKKRSVTTSGMIIDVPLGKAQCMSCGTVQRITKTLLGDGDFYRKQYQTYFTRPGALTFDRGRYQAMSAWMKNAVPLFQPQNIMDVGCGRGWTMMEMGQLYPHVPIMGIEPSEEDARIARECGLDVLTSALAGSQTVSQRYDLVYSNNVIQHSLSPKQFLIDLANLVSDDGLIVLTCPDSTKPNNEMMWSDQNISLAPSHLFKLASGLGLRVLAWQGPPPVTTLMNKQLVVLSKAENTSLRAVSDAPSYFEVSDNIKKRERYLACWESLDDYLCQSSSSAAHVYNFGASMWSHLLRCYCPEYWRSISSCIVDDFAGQFMDKEVVPYQEITFTRDDVVILGTEPLNQEQLEMKLREKKLSAKVVIWKHLVPQ